MCDERKNFDYLTPLEKQALTHKIEKETDEFDLGGRREEFIEKRKDQQWDSDVIREAADTWMEEVRKDASRTLFGNDKEKE